MLRFEFEAMASPCEIALEGEGEALLRRAADEAIAEVRRIETKYSRYRSDSIVSRINSGQTVEVDDETGALLDFAAQLWTDSGGLFDITSGVLRRAWDFKAGRVPAQEELAALLPLVGWQRVQRDGASIRLPHAGMEIDFGGIGKEYAADRAASVLLAHGVVHALVNLGGDIHVLGPHADGTPWQIAVEHPRGAADAVAAVPLARGGIATSGDYERAFEQDGVRYCHILDPRSGWPVNAWQSVTVLAANTTAAGALATIAMLKQADALAWLDAQQASYLAVRADGALFRRDPAAGSQ